MLGGILSLTIVDSVYFGVAVPTGTIIGLIIYLFYYALFSRGGAGAEEESDGIKLPFHVDRLLKSIGKGVGNPAVTVFGPDLGRNVVPVQDLIGCHRLCD